MPPFPSPPHDWPVLLATRGVSPEEIFRLSLAVGLRKRAHRKVSPVTLLTALLEESINGHPSYNDLAARVEDLDGVCVSRQTLGNKINDTCVQLIQAVWTRVMAHHVSVCFPHLQALRGTHPRILIQDSTILRLPTRLFPQFSGVANGHTQVCNARLQIVYDLLNERVIHFSLDPYGKNDQKAAPELELQRGDLVLRDRGYLTYDEIARHRRAGADCIYRHKFSFSYLDPETEQPLDLVKLLQQKGHLDMEVRLNHPSRTRVRLVAIPVDEETANRRRQKLKKESHGKNPSADLLFLQSWTILITTLPVEVASRERIQEMYGLRWRIEMIFKMWKSHWHLDRIHNVSEAQLKVLLGARLIAAALFQQGIYLLASQRIRETSGHILSLMKLTRYLARFPHRLAEIWMALQEPSEPHPILEVLIRYCTYDKRKRLNYVQKKEACLQAFTLS
jgi:hypothetical protein